MFSEEIGVPVRALHRPISKLKAEGRNCSAGECDLEQLEKELLHLSVAEMGRAVEQYHDGGQTGTERKRRDLRAIVDGPRSETTVVAFDLVPSVLGYVGSMLENIDLLVSTGTRVGPR